MQHIPNEKTSMQLTACCVIVGEFVEIISTKCSIVVPFVAHFLASFFKVQLTLPANSMLKLLQRVYYGSIKLTKYFLKLIGTLTGVNN